MKSIIILLLLWAKPVCLAGDFPPSVYLEYGNDLHKLNLSGYVKKVLIFQEVFCDEIDDESKQILSVVTIFNSDGYIIDEVSIDGFGDTVSTNNNLYDTKGHLITRYYKEYFNPENEFFINNYYDRKGKLKKSVSRIIRLNDSLITFFTYNDKGDKSFIQVNGYQTDSLEKTVQYNYDYDENGKKKTIEMIQGTDMNSLALRNIYRFNDDGYMVEHIEDNPRFERITKLRINYKSDRIKNLKRYENEELVSVKEFDGNGNLVIKIYYEDSTISEYSKYEYEYDEKGNWIRKTHLRKSTGEDEFKCVSVQHRKIEYYDD